MRKIKVATPGGGKKIVRVSRVGRVLWDGVTGTLTMEHEPAYEAITQAVASLMLVSDHVCSLVCVRADVYPMYDNPHAVQVVLSVVAANAGEVAAHYPESVKAVLPTLAQTATNLGLEDRMFRDTETQPGEKVEGVSARVLDFPKQEG